MAATLATTDTILKEIYEPRIRNQLNDDCVGSKRIERTSEGVTDEVGGKYVVFPIRTKRNAGLGARKEMEALPTPGQQGHEAGRVKLKYLYGGVRLSGQVIKLADKNFQAFSSKLSLEMDGLRTDLSKDWNRQFYGTNAGIMAKCKTGSGTAKTTIIVANTQYLGLGDVVDIVDSTTLGNASPTVLAAAREITDIAEGTGTVTFTGAAVTTTTDHVIIRAGSVNREITGLEQIVKDSGAIYNIDPANVSLWKSRVDANAGTPRAISEGLMVENCDWASKNGGNTTLLLSNLGVRRAYFNLLVQQRRYQGTTEFTGGFKGLSFTTDRGDIPYVTDIDCPPNTLYGLNEKEMKIYRESDWSFMDMDGSRWQRVIGYDAYEATMFMYAELGTHRRNSHFVIKDLIEG